MFNDKNCMNNAQPVLKVDFIFLDSEQRKLFKMLDCYRHYDNITIEFVNRNVNDSMYDFTLHEYFI